jgi:hypothetical protein
MAWDSNPLHHICSDWPWGPPTIHYNWYFLRIEQMEHGIYHPLHLALRFRMSRVIYLLHLLRLHWHIMGRPLPLPLHNIKFTEYVQWYESANTGVTCVTIYFMSKCLTIVTLLQFQPIAVSESEISCSRFTQITKITSVYSLFGTSSCLPDNRVKRGGLLGNHQMRPYVLNYWWSVPHYLTSGVLYIYIHFIYTACSITMW